MKQSGKKPRTRAVKKKKRKKLSARDRILAVVVAGVLISIAVAASMAVFYLRSAKAGNEAVSMRASPALPVAQAPLPPEAAPAQKPAPVPENVAAQKPTEKAPVPSVRSAPAAARPGPARQGTSVPPAKIPPAENRPAVSLPQGGLTERPPVPSRGTLAFVIDDAGNNLRDLEPFLKIPGPLTIAVLPGLPYSAEAARRIRAAGKEVFLHQPMEALGGTNPGPGAIMAGMGRDEIRAIISRNLEELGPVAGINNHEGSRITMDEEAMETVLALCREKGIVFLDSRTTAGTAAPGAAMRLGMTIGERDVFVDNIQERASMINYINTGLEKAEQKGSALMIGHVWSPALAPLLSESFPDISAKGYTFSLASKLISGKKP